MLVSKDSCDETRETELNRRKKNIIFFTGKDPGPSSKLFGLKGRGGGRTSSCRGNAAGPLNYRLLIGCYRSHRVYDLVQCF